MNKIYIKYYAVSSWMSPEMWDDYFRSMEAILNDKLWKLDVNDPHRRNADTEAGEGDYVVKFNEKQEVKWIHGKYQKSKITFTLKFYRT